MDTPHGGVAALPVAASEALGPERPVERRADLGHERVVDDAVAERHRDDPPWLGVGDHERLGRARVPRSGRELALELQGLGLEVEEEARDGALLLLATRRPASRSDERLEGAQPVEEAALPSHVGSLPGRLRPEVSRIQPPSMRPVSSRRSLAWR